MEGVGRKEKNNWGIWDVLLEERCFVQDPTAKKYLLTRNTILTDERYGFGGFTKVFNNKKKSSLLLEALPLLMYHPMVLIYKPG